MKFAIQESVVEPRKIEVDIAENLGESGGRVMSSYEAQEMNQLKAAHDLQDAAAALDETGAKLAVIPTFGMHFQPLEPVARSALAVRIFCRNERLV